MYKEPVEPTPRDSYTDLGVSEFADAIDIKKAYHRLALRHHPDKKAPGECGDDTKFKQINAAFETLRDQDKRDEYDEDYWYVKEEWVKYRAELERYEEHRDERERQEAERAQRLKRAEERARKKEAERAEADRKRKIEAWRLRLSLKKKWEEIAIWEIEQHQAAKRAGIVLSWSAGRYYCGCAGCFNRRKRQQDQTRIPPMSHEERLEFLEWKAEEASRAAAQRAREEQEQKAKKRLAKDAAVERKRKAKESAADERSKEIARRQRETQKRDAKVRLAKEWIKKKQDQQIEELERRGQKLSLEEVTVNIAWVKTKGVATCFFCDIQIKQFSFRCPDGDAIACNPCKNKLSRFVPPDMDKEGGVDSEGE